MTSLSISSLEARTKRGSRSLPVPLIFKSTSEHVEYLNSPPATGAKSAKTFNKQKSLAAHLLPTMPYTPVSPLPRRVTVIQEDEAVPANQTEVSEADSPRSSPSRSLKRKSPDDNESIDAQYPVKQRILSSRLIINPITMLQKQGVPLQYIMHKIPEVVAPLFNRPEGASCFIRAVPQTHIDAVRINVIPLLDPSKSFRLKCDRKGEHDHSTKDYAEPIQTVDFVCEAAIPLHIEAVYLRAPVLAGILLSGHVFMGDTLEIELPYPEVFSDLMRCLYTGKARRANREKIAACMAIIEGNPST